MKPHTREILDLCTECLVDAGLQRKRRGLAIWSLNQQMAGAICLSHQDFKDGSVRIDTVPQVYWEPVQKIYSAGIGEKYRFTHIPTRSRMWSFINHGEPDLIFAPNTIPAPNFSRLKEAVQQSVIPKVIELADKQNILEFYRKEVPCGGDRPEMFLAISAVLNRSTQLDEELEWIMSVLNEQMFVDSVTAFYRRIRCSPDVLALLD